MKGIVLKKCDVCRQDVLVDQFENGKCSHCGWKQDSDALDFPNEVRYPNRVSYNKAIQFYEDGKSLTPTFQDFIEMYNFYGEVEFYYQGKRYGVTAPKGEIDFYEFNVLGSFQTYQKVEDFAAQANINGVLLKDLWNDVENANYMQCD